MPSKERSLMSFPHHVNCFLIRFWSDCGLVASQWSVLVGCQGRASERKTGRTPLVANSSHREIRMCKVCLGFRLNLQPLESLILVDPYRIFTFCFIIVPSLLGLDLSTCYLWESNRLRSVLIDFHGQQFFMIWWPRRCPAERKWSWMVRNGVLRERELQAGFVDIVLRDATKM